MEFNEIRKSLRANHVPPNCQIFGTPTLFCDTVLPTYEDVIKCYLHERHQLKMECNKDPSATEIAKSLSEKIASIWKKASIPCITEKRIVKKIIDYQKSYRNILKSAHKKNIAFKERSEAFCKEAKCKLFDVSCCKCDPITKCRCIKAMKVPKKEHAFLLDQRSTRKMMMGSVDKKFSKRQQRAYLRNKLSTSCDENQSSSTKGDVFQISLSSSSETGDEFAPSSYHESMSLRKRALPNTPKHKPPQKSKKLCLTRVAEACDRAGVSDRAAAIICSSLLCDVDEDGGSSPVVDRSKIRRERKNTRKNYQEKEKPKSLEGIYFDGRKDSTIVQEKIESKYYRKKITEEHISLVVEPGSEYLGHTTPKSGKSSDVSESIVDHLVQNNLTYDETVALGCDGTAVNTGWKGGVLRNVELKANRPMHWFICLLHANELPLRHLMGKLDGKTSGPKGFSGDIGKSLDGCERKEVVEYETIPSDLPDVNREDLSTDQKYMYDIHQAVVKGECSPDLARRNPGKIAHSRWLTTANRLLRLYISEPSPSEILVLVIHYVMKVYVPVWFSIKKDWKCVNGPQNLFKLIELSRTLPDKVVEIVLPVIEHNAYFAHPENIILAMISDPRSFIREIGWRRIKKCREENKEKTVRIFKVPKLVIGAQDYSGMINWQEEFITEPPLTRNMSVDDIDDNIRNKAVFQAPAFPCHTQAVERCVKLVTEASNSVYGKEKRDGFIRTRIAARKKMPIFETKSQFVR